MEAVEAAELLDRALVVVSAQVDEDVGEASIAAVLLHDEQRCRLLAPAVATGGLGCGEAVDQPRGERSPCGRRERVDHGSTVLAETRMFPCAAKPAPARPPAQSWHSVPV